MRGGSVRTGSERGGERVDAVCDDQACGSTGLAPLSSNAIRFSLRFLASVPLFLFSLYDLGSVGNRTGGVERPHGLDCTLKSLVSCLSLASLHARSPIPSGASAGLLTDFDGELLHAEQHFGGIMWR